MLAIFSAALLACIWVSPEASEFKGTVVQDWLTLSSRVQVGRVPAGRHVSGWNYIQHLSSKKYIRPYGGNCPNEQLNLQIGDTFTEAAHQFKFVQVDGPLGYIEHKCGLVVNPASGSTNPSANTRLVLKSTHGSPAYFYIDEVEEVIEHIGGKIWHPDDGHLIPVTGTDAVLHSGRHSAALFNLVPVECAESVYPPPTLSGSWRILFGATDPTAGHTYTINYKVGKAVTKKVHEKVYWKVLETTALSWFQKFKDFSRYACIAQPETWSEAVGKEYILKVNPGETSVIWQWVFCAERLGEEYCFRSTILADTDDINRKPVITPEMGPSTC